MEKKTSLGLLVLGSVAFGHQFKVLQSSTLDQLGGGGPRKKFKKRFKIPLAHGLTNVYPSSLPCQPITGCMVLIPVAWSVVMPWANSLIAWPLYRPIISFRTVIKKHLHWKWLIGCLSRLWMPRADTLCHLPSAYYYLGIMCFIDQSALDGGCYQYHISDFTFPRLFSSTQ